MPYLLTPEPLNRDAFSRFGDVIETDGSQQYPINDGNATRFHDLATVDVNAEGGRPLISVFRSKPFPSPFQVKMMERHPLSSQAFIPMSKDPFWVLVSPADEEPTPENLRLFVTNGEQGVNIHRGVWHHPLLVLVEQQDFLIVDRGGPEKNCDEFYFDSATEIGISAD